ncbi:MAG: HAD-IIIA family hydrolase [Saprospiraceae bacterium]|jgi:3-deoxy-D-manno-octulosonate 8-phosphate phosphatase (KDO 8-P phosphatase)|nr:HAD-IIIA family hydrolase [Saprospiraceae bacterium]
MSTLQSFSKIQTFIFDVDGVLTDGSILITEEGTFLRRMHTRDGFAMKLAIQNGYNIAIITGGSSAGVEHRLRLLGIQSIYSGSTDKLPQLEAYLQTHPCNPDGILYMGDDLPDLAVMEKVGLPACPADADPAIINVSKYISSKNGGQGCVRDVIEKTMRIQARWPFP